MQHDFKSFSYVSFRYFIFIGKTRDVEGCLPIKNNILEQNFPEYK